MNAKNVCVATCLLVASMGCGRQAPLPHPRSSSEAPVMENRTFVTRGPISLCELARRSDVIAKAAVLGWERQEDSVAHAPGDKGQPSPVMIAVERTLKGNPETSLRVTIPGSVTSEGHTKEGKLVRDESVAHYFFLSQAESGLVVMSSGLFLPDAAGRLRNNGSYHSGIDEDSFLSQVQKYRTATSCD